MIIVALKSQPLTSASYGISRATYSFAKLQFELPRAKTAVFAADEWSFTSASMRTSIGKESDATMIPAVIAYWSGHLHRP